MFMDLIVLLSEVALGIALGFFLSDNRPGLSLDDVKVSSIVFVVVIGFVMLTHPEANVMVFAHLAIGWALINASMLAGELLRINLFRYVRNAIAKKDVQLLVSDFVRLSTRYGFTGAAGDRENALTKLAEVREQLKKVHRRAERFDQKITDRLDVIGELCEHYFETAVIVTQETSPQKRDEILRHWGELGNTLTDISWDTLNHAEANINFKISAVWGRPIKSARG